MATLKDLKAKMKEDAALAAKFDACKSLDEMIELAGKEGYEITEEEIEKLTSVNEAELKKAAGGKIAFIASTSTFLAY